MNATEFELLGELENEFEQEAMELEPLSYRRGASAQSFGMSEWGALELGGGLPGLPIPGTIHRFDCPGGCPATLTAAQCRGAVRQAIRVAIDLATNAANKLEIPTKLQPSMRDPTKDADAIQTAGFFRSFFGHDPSMPISYAGNEPSGVSVAKRFRAVAKELGGARRMIFRCVPTTCPAGGDTTLGDATHPACCRATTRAFTAPNRPALRSVVHLCPAFWNLPEASRGGTILHEMLHLLFATGAQGFLRDTGRRANAHCYKAFALRVKGHGRDLGATCACWGRPIDNECRRRLGLPPIP
jgi:hypothetical protein